VTPFPVVHDERAGPCFGYRIEAGNRVVAYSGDTEWTEELVALGRGADLFICECYVREQKVRAHLSLAELRRELPRIGAKRFVLTHMSAEMLAHLSEVPFETASDGLRIDL
jgi:ribonuclease BN (tRNA processing enzyme)